MTNMTERRYVGRLHNQTKEEIHITDGDQIIPSEKEAYNEKIFFTTQTNHYEENALAINVPKSKLDELAGVKAKRKELQQCKNLDISEVIDTNEAKSKVID